MRKPIEYTLAVMDTPSEVSRGCRYATGTVLELPKSDFTENADWEAIFRRWINSTSYCEKEPVRDADLSFAESIFRTATIDEHDVCAILLGGSLDVDRDIVKLTTNVFPHGRFGEDLTKYLGTVEQIMVAPRFIRDSDGKITGVPAWDLVLPSGWNYKPYIYNDVNDEDFITDLSDFISICKEKQVGWSMHYAEVSQDWYFQVTSAAQSECFIGKNKMLKNALDDASQHVANIGK